MRERTLVESIVHQFVSSRLSVLFVLVSLACGAIALLATPREEEPQIVVPMAEILIQAPGASVEQVERLVSIPLEQKLKKIEDVEHLYATSFQGSALMTVRYEVGTDIEDALLRLYNELDSNQDAIPPIVTNWIVKPKSIDDVPILVFNLLSQTLSADEMRLIAQEAALSLEQIPESSTIRIFGGRSEEIRATIDIGKLNQSGIDGYSLIEWIRSNGQYQRVGSLENRNQAQLLDVGNQYRNLAQIRDLPIADREGTLFRLADIADVQRTWAPRTSYLWHQENGGTPWNMVSIAVAKRKGSNAVSVADGLIERMEALHGDIIPEDVRIEISRNYGETANEKVNELVKHLLIAIATIVGLLAFMLGWRESLIVAMAVPITLSLTLIMDLAFGYTINRVTLFALILSLGLLVDDPIVGVENISRHMSRARKGGADIIAGAIQEIFSPTLIATIAVVISFIPLYFVTGMMGPYMEPMPFNIPIAMFWSLVVAITITPWACARILRADRIKHHADDHLGSSALERAYRATMHWLMSSRARMWLVILLSLVAFGASVALVPLGMVPFKMLPFDNKNELLIVIDAPEPYTLEQTANAASALATSLSLREDIQSAQVYAGTHSPIDFNGLVRKYYFRSGSNVAEIRLNLLPKDQRQPSHDIAMDIRGLVESIAAEQGVIAKIVEMPPGPPVMQTVVAEVSGPPHGDYQDLETLGRQVQEAFDLVPGVVDIDNYSSVPQPVLHLQPELMTAAHTGAPAGFLIDIAAAMVDQGMPLGLVQDADKLEPLPLVLRLGDPDNTSLDQILGLQVRDQVPLGALVEVREGRSQAPRYRKDMQPVYFVTADAVGISPIDAVLAINEQLPEIPAGYSVNWLGEGEPKITLDAFRDMGLAFLGAVVGIYVLLVAQTGVLMLPAIMIVAIPFTLVGVLPGFWLLNLVMSQDIGEFHQPVFFTATAFIGIIALAGIVVRNSIILIDFIENYRRTSDDTHEAILRAGTIRMRPIVLTALAAMFGAWVIVLDPIFSGLAWAFIFGISASTAFSLVLIPVIYKLMYTQPTDSTHKEHS